MGTGTSGAKSNSASGGMTDFPEAFAPGKDFGAVGGVNHVSRTVSRTTQGEWDRFSAPLNQNLSTSDENAIMRDFTARNGLTGYVRTQNAFKINQAFYDPANNGKTVDQMFTKTSDRRTVRALDRAINNHQTQANASYTRFSSPSGVQGAFGLTNSQMGMLQQAQSMNPQQLRTLNRALSGSQSFSRSYTSTSANRSLNAFSNPSAPQSRGFIFERRISVQKGTNAFAPRKNAQESEVIFGRNMQTKLNGVSIASDGHIVLHESFMGYK